MLERPLIPILLSLAGGILTAHIGLPHHSSLPLVFFVIVSSLLIGSLFLSSKLRFVSALVLFFLVGVFLYLAEDQDSDLLWLANEGKRVVMEGTVVEPPTIIDEMATLVVRSDRVFMQGSAREVREKFQVTVYSHGREFAPGEKIRFPARLRPFRNFNNPGRYDYELAMRIKGLSCAASVSDGRSMVAMGKGDLGFPMGLLEMVRGPIRRFFRETLSPEDQALFRALILGERQDIGPERMEIFSTAGLGHILAVSGLHIGLVAWLAFFVFRRLLSISYWLTLRIDIQRLAAALTALPVVGYTCLAGLQISSQRAMIMVLAYLWSMILGREKEIWSTFALAALVILALDPYSLFSISFQLSFGAVMGILWLVPRIYDKVSAPLKEGLKGRRFVGPLYMYFVGLIVVTLSAMIFLMPMTSFYFHRISLVGIPANVTAVPILGLWIIPLGLLSAVSLPLSSPLASLFIHLGAWGMEGMTRMIGFWAQWPWSSFWVVTPSLFEMSLAYGLIFFVYFIRRWSWAKPGLLIVFSLLAVDIGFWSYTTRFHPHLEVTYLDVGQGNSAVIKFPGKERMLIDGGGFARSSFDVGRMVVAPYLLRSKIRRIDYVVLSHPQADHMNGLRFIASHFRPKEFWYNGDRVNTESFTELMGVLESKGIRKLFPADLRGGREISGVKVDILHPSSNTGMPFSRTEGLNNNSMVVRLSYDGISLLFPGDLEASGEERVVSNAGSLLRSDVLLVPHHGSRDSCSMEFLERVRPRICIISSGSGNYFGFPHRETLEKLEAVGCKVIRLDEVGAVRVAVGSDGLEVKSFLRDPLQ